MCLATKLRVMNALDLVLGVSVLVVSYCFTLEAEIPTCMARVRAAFRDPLHSCSSSKANSIRLTSDGRSE